MLLVRRIAGSVTSAVELKELVTRVESWTKSRANQCMLVFGLILTAASLMTLLSTWTSKVRCSS